MWAARPTDQDMEATVDQGDPYNAIYPKVDNKGTNPHLQAAKYTGYGITLRAAVDTPQELSIHLVQIDDGPNYRWGIASEARAAESISMRMARAIATMEERMLAIVSIRIPISAQISACGKMAHSARSSECSIPPALRSLRCTICADRSAARNRFLLLARVC